MNDLVQYGFYLGLVVATGLGEYFKLLPPNTLVAILGLVTGHFFGNGALKQPVNQILTSVNRIGDNLAAVPQPTSQTKEAETSH